MSETWKEDKFVKNWFELLGNKRTINNYSREFPKFLKYIEAQTPYKTPSQIIESEETIVLLKLNRGRRFISYVI
jgi:hypothetical protein